MSRPQANDARGMPTARKKASNETPSCHGRTLTDPLLHASNPSFEFATFEMIGSWLVFDGLSDATLNKRWLQVVHLFPANPSRVCVDATLHQDPPEQVRYVNVPIAKATQMVSCLGPGRMTGASLNVWQFMHSDNRSEVLSSCCLDANRIECIPVRPHSAVQLGCMWRDLPLLCAELNRSGSPGYPFRLEVGFSLFCTNTGNRVEEVVDGFYSAEPHLILRDCRGCGIDLAPDIGETSLTDAETFACSHKLYVPDPRVDYAQFMNVYEAVNAYVQTGMMANVVHEEYTRGCEENPVALGMIDDNINAEWTHPQGHMLMITPFLDPHMRLRVADNKKTISKFLKKRRTWIAEGCVWISLRLWHELAEAHGDDDAKQMQLLSRRNLGVICYGCHVRTTQQESRLCGGCGKARYCSEACQRNHWSCHRLRCVPKEERDRRREMTKKVQEEHEERVRKYEAREAKVADEVRQQNAARTARIAKEREERERQRREEVVECVRRAESAGWRPPRHAKKKSDGGVDRSTGEKLIREAWNSERERAARSAAFDSKQAEEHEQAVLGRREARVRAMRKLEAEASAAGEAARHVVPPSPRLSEFL